MINVVFFIIIEKVWKYINVKILLFGKDLIFCKVFKEFIIFDSNFFISDMFINIFIVEVILKF